jgi:hypothetical protein
MLRSKIKKKCNKAINLATEDERVERLKNIQFFSFIVLLVFLLPIVLSINLRKAFQVLQAARDMVLA